MSIENYLEILPTKIVESNTYHLGLFLRFSTSKEKWFVGYGSERVKRFEKNKDEVGIGDTPLQAFEDLVVKIKEYKWSDKYGK